MLIASYRAEYSATMHGIWPKKGATRVGSGADLVVPERGDFTFDENSLVDRPEMNWSPYHGRHTGACRGDVAARGERRFVRRESV